MRTERFVAALKAAPAFDPTDKAVLIHLQGNIVDSRYAATDWRDFQNFVGDTVGGYRQEVHFICPRPEDVPGLMDAWMVLMRRVADGGVDPVIAAAVSAFAFVFIHPFEDGNGRIHRYLIHHVLAERGFNPPGVVFPVSAAILERIDAYRRVLESYSQRLLPLIEWEPTATFNVRVKNDTGDFYRFFDATPHAEFLYGCVQQTIEQDLPDETAFLRRYDQFRSQVDAFIDMPDNTIDLLFRFLHQNGGRFSARAREREFRELTDNEAERIEAIYGEVFANG
jgi:hypothetical protein